MHQVILLFLGIIGPILCQTVHNEAVLRGQPYDISADIGWTDGISVEWNLQVENDAKIKLICTDIRMQQSTSQWTPDCPEVSLNLEDLRGTKKICNSSVRDFIYLSDGPKLKVKVLASSLGSIIIKCIALNTGNPNPEEIIKMDPHKKLRKIEVGSDRERLPKLDRFWVFESPAGTRMSFQCDVNLSEPKPICGWSSLTFNNGETSEEVCAYNKLFVWFSKENKASLRLQLDERGFGIIKCIVQAVTGPNPDEYENVIPKEEDSSEDGVTPGARKTSCKCGWANKGTARIIRGQEARVNEFPWMVHLYAAFDTEVGYLTNSCGASIITPRHILTAAHCVVFTFNNGTGMIANVETIKMILAKHDETKPTGKEITIRAERVFVRDIYLQKGLYFEDIALIFTKETIDFSTPIVGPVCLEREEYPMYNWIITIMGWGAVNQTSMSNYLKKGVSVVMDPYHCDASPWDLCVTSKINSLCSGDSGGPLVRLDSETNRFTQVSVASRGSCFGKFMVSTIVSYFYDWIQDVIKATDPSLQTCQKI